MRCLQKGTQNANESLNNIIWSRIPKSTFVMRDTLEIGVYKIVATYNKGHMARVEILEQLGITPGQQYVATIKSSIKSES